MFTCSLKTIFSYLYVELQDCVEVRSTPLTFLKTSPHLVTPTATQTSDVAG